MAHPERYTYMGEKDYHRLKDAGVMFQSNLPSLVGMYGNLVKKKIEGLCSKNMINLYGTDTHRLLLFRKMLVMREKLQL